MKEKGVTYREPHFYNDNRIFFIVLRAAFFC